MSSVLETGGRGLVGNRVMLWLLAAGSAGRSMQSPRPAADVPATVDARDVQASPRASFSADRDLEAARLDAVAGSEFVDDRIRLQE